MIRCFHGDTDVTDQFIDLVFSTFSGSVGVHHFTIALIRNEEAFSVVCDESSEALSHVQQIDLWPQIDQTIG